MKILVIGGSGFIGRHVVDQLSGHDVAVLHRGKTAMPTTRSILGDRKKLRESRDAIAAFAPDVVIDLIPSSGAQAEALLDVIDGARIVAASSMDVYRACGVLHGLEDGPLEPLPLTETSALRTKLQTYPPQQIAMLQQVFGWLDEAYDKIPIERTLLARAKTTVLRLPAVYGPGDPLRRLWPIVKRIDDGRPVLLSDSLAAWRWTRGYVEDVAHAFVLAATNPAASGVYNVGEPEALGEREWAQAVGANVVVVPDDRLPAHLRMPGNTAQQWIADSSHIRADLGYAEIVGRDEAIRRTVAWERATPAVGFVPYVFDYAAEDAALA